MTGNAVVMGIELMADIGIGAMAGTIARALTPENANKVMKACIFIGGVAVGGCAAEAANKYIEDYAESVKAAAVLIKEKRANKKAKNEEEPIEETEEVIDVEEVETKKEEVIEEKPKKAAKKTK